MSRHPDINTEETEAENMDNKKLIKAAIDTLQYSYAPYSDFKVAAALVTSEDEVYTGCNIENASYGLSICAERNAVFAAVCSGVRRFKTLCVVADTDEPVAPCGACRQVLAEFPFEKIILANCKGQTKTMSVAELLPYGFGSESLNIKNKCK